MGDSSAAPDPGGEAGSGGEVDVLVVGAGFAGVGLGIRLARRGRESFVVLERGHDVGGTWRDNVYPGVASDVPAHLYSFSFLPPADWSHVFAAGPEIQAYLRDAARAEGVLPHLRLGADVRRATWDEATGRWRVESDAGTWLARSLVLAVGRLSEPALPDPRSLPGLDTADIPVFHSARWRAESLAGKRVGVVGTGASAAQIVPALAGEAAEVVVFQRTPAYVVPRQDRAYTPAERRDFHERPETARALREELFAELDTRIRQRQGLQPDLDRVRALALGHLAAQVPDAGLRARLTPAYEIGCKRILLSDDFYPALGRTDVHLEASALRRLDGDVATAVSGARHRLDALVLATGFQSTQLPFARRVVGRGGEVLAERWSGGMTAFASTTVHGYPNMFVLDGPNASLGHNSAIFMIETQLDYVLGALDHLAGTPAALEPTAAAEAAYTREVDDLSRSTVWLRGDCSSWYVDPRSGRLTLLWPGSGRSFRERNGTFDPAPYRPVQATGPPDPVDGPEDRVDLGGGR